MNVGHNIICIDAQSFLSCSDIVLLGKDFMTKVLGFEYTHLRAVQLVLPNTISLEGQLHCRQGYPINWHLVMLQPDLTL